MIGMMGRLKKYNLFFVSILFLSFSFDQTMCFKKPQDLIEFNYNQVFIKDILNEFAQMRGINIVYPQTEQVSAKVTFDAGKKITMAEAWDFLIMILEQAGFGLVPQEGSTYRLVANKKLFVESVPLYINVDYTSLPNSSEKIRYVYYFNNIQLSKQQTEINTILKNILTDQDFGQQYIPDLSSNSMILTTKSETVKSIMQLISVLDETGFQETVEILNMEYAQAAEVAQILTNMIAGTSDKGGSGGYVSLAGGTPRAKYFSEYAKIISLDAGGRKLNSVVVMGKAEDVSAIKDFIKKYLDVVQQQGKSFFHVVDLQWIQVVNCVQVLGQLIQGAGSQTSQSTISSSSKLAFDPQIKIVPEQSGNQNQGQQQGQGGPASGGGNRMVIAAPEKDWVRIQALIKEIDIPQKQIVIEALVMDLDLQFTRRLGSQLRTRGLCPSIFPKDMQAQAALIGNHIVETDASSGDTNLVGDLSQLLNPDQEGPGVGNIFCSPTTPGMTTLMVNQGKNVSNGVWGFFQFLSTHKSAKILTRPLIIASNLKPAKLGSSITKQLAGSTSAGVAPSVNYQTEAAPISIEFTPVISENDTINLQVSISLNTWADPTSESNGTQFKRTLQSNLFMKSGDVVILGGLTKDRIAKIKSSMPFFDNIPIIGNLVSTRNQETTKDQLFVLIKPTIVDPEHQGGMNALTSNAMHFMKDQFSEYEDAFANLKDPITRWFFNDTQRSSDKIEKKLEQLAGTDEEQVFEKHNPSSPMKSDILQEGSSSNGSSIHVNWMSDNQYSAKKEQKPAIKSKDLDSLSKQLAGAVNPFQRLQL